MHSSLTSFSILGQISHSFVIILSIICAFVEPSKGAYPCISLYKIQPNAQTSKPGLAVTLSRRTSGGKYFRDPACVGSLLKKPDIPKSTICIYNYTLAYDIIYSFFLKITLIILESTDSKRIFSSLRSLCIICCRWQ